jgi:uncharacterized protein with ATP-grasp and redox domains
MMQQAVSTATEPDRKQQSIIFDAIHLMGSRWQQEKVSASETVNATMVDMMTQKTQPLPELNGSFNHK